MGFIDAVRAWLFGADDDVDDPSESSGETDAADGDGGAGDAGGEADGLDPAAATETRTAAATDDAVDALRDVRESGPPGDEGGSDGESETDDGRERPPDDDRRKR
ncbi:hypothetical protein [Halorubrum tebenquichense]|uniref:Uncharacterized protein n=1 Tax=Halorubrum tebenquichense DSM 14210 TaxID=1227485 RepID=M0DZE7_9EURY|nr:hypothetical protein [Halorubrum tebenquichense]ELZ39459.1 hypothetical protein C472_04073 [Halorubrum tebenquichense DSM 14210]